MSKYSPIVVFAYNRLSSIKQVLTNLNKCDLSNETEVFVFVDGNKNDKDFDSVNSVKEYLYELKKNNNFLNFNINESPTNNGVDKSIISGVTKIINQYGRVIVLEDDIVVSNKFLEYMNKSLDYYANNSRIFSIAGYCPNINLDTNDVFFFNRIESWGWASWADRWNNIDWGLTDLDSFINNQKEIDRFNRGGNDLTEILLANMDAWDIRACYTSFKNGSYTVYPPKSLVKNIGFNGDGTHFKKITHKYDVEIENDYLPNIVPFNINKKTNKKMHDFYSISELKYSLKKIKKIIKRVWRGI